jgi:hypothetical protein
VNPRLQAALDVHRGCRRIDPSGSEEREGGKRPNKRQPDDKPSHKESEDIEPAKWLGLSF